MTWKPWVIHTSTQEMITDVVRARARHWERYLHDRCPLDGCERGNGVVFSRPYQTRDPGTAPAPRVSVIVL